MVVVVVVVWLCGGGGVVVWWWWCGCVVVWLCGGDGVVVWRYKYLICWLCVSGCCVGCSKKRVILTTLNSGTRL